MPSGAGRGGVPDGEQAVAHDSGLLDPAGRRGVDPLVILRDLPEREREEFLRQTVNAAHDPAGYQRMRRLPHVWSLTAIAARQPGYYEELAAARAGTATTVPVTDVIPDWAARVASAKGLAVRDVPAPVGSRWPRARRFRCRARKLLLRRHSRSMAR